MPNVHKTHPVTLRIPAELRAWAETKARDENRSIASIYTQALELLRKENQMWVILVNRKLTNPTIYGPVADYEEAVRIEQELAKHPMVKSTMIKRLSGVRMEDNQLIHEAFV